MSRELWREWKRDEKTEKEKAKLEALLQVSKAREHGIISQKNIMKMDQKVNSSVSKILQKTNPEICTVSMPEGVERDAQGSASKRELPLIKNRFDQKGQKSDSQ